MPILKLQVHLALVKVMYDFTQLPDDKFKTLPN